MITYKPWGLFRVIVDEPGFKVKRILVSSGESISYQYHSKRSEIWSISSGTGILTLNEQERQVKSGDLIYINVGDRHRITNTGIGPLVIYELQHGELCCEDDIVRLEDKYGRKS